MTPTPSPKQATVRVLLVEDNPADVRMIQEALREAKVRAELTSAQDGEEALDILRRRGPHAKAPRPDLILLDLNMPRMNGLEFLAEMKQDEAVRDIPVVVLTNSEYDKDLKQAYALRVNSYMVKPIDLDLVNDLFDWFHGFQAQGVEARA